MKYYISHRGNLDGSNPQRENAPDYIREALLAGFHVEVDLFDASGADCFLGHDKAQYKTSLSFLQDERIWVHCKQPAALDFLSQQENVHYFWHETDAYTLTSRGFLWTYPERPLLQNSIAVLAEPEPHCAGACSDYISSVKKRFASSS